jgi:hypothetical protein
MCAVSFFKNEYKTAYINAQTIFREIPCSVAKIKDLDDIPAWNSCGFVYEFGKEFMVEHCRGNCGVKPHPTFAVL